MGAPPAPATFAAAAADVPPPRPPAVPRPYPPPPTPPPVPGPNTSHGVACLQIEHGAWHVARKLNMLHAWHFCGACEHARHPWAVPVAMGRAGAEAACVLLARKFGMRSCMSVRMFSFRTLLCKLGLCLPYPRWRRSYHGAPREAMMARCGGKPAKCSPFNVYSS